MPDSPLNICMVTTFYPPYHFGGDALFVQALCRELADRGHRIHVIHNADAYRLRRPEPAADHPFQDDPRITVHSLRTPLHWPAALLTHQTGCPGFYGPAMRRILATGFDVIHYHNASLVGAPGILPFAKALKIYTPHEYWLLCPRHDLFRYGREACSSRTCLRCTLAARRPPQLWRQTPWFRRRLKSIDLLLAPSRFSLRIHREHGYPGDIVHLPLFVPGSAQANAPVRDRSSPSSSMPHVLFAGRLEHGKGLQTIIPVFARQNRVRLVVAGDGDMGPDLRTFSAGSPAIEFTGFISPGSVRQLAGTALAVLVPSLLYEVSPLVILDAFSRGTPVIVRRHGAMPEFVEESNAGFCFDREDEIPGLVARLLDEPGLRDRLGQAARNAFARLWQPSVHIDRYLALIRSRLPAV